jgi:putative methyltransferase (TIGR04325 family)
MTLYANMKNMLARIERIVGFGSPRTHLEYSGPYSTWKTAQENSVGYESEIVLEKIYHSTKKVILGECAYERDGTTFQEKPLYSRLSFILGRLIENETKVIDFGGGLGGTYLENRQLFEGKSVSYFVVEQSNFVTTGQALANEFNLPIQFERSITQEVLDNADVLIMSGVLQYLENYQEIISTATSLNVKYVLIDRTPLTNSPTQIFVQENEGYYYPKVSYPVRKINRKELLDLFPSYIVNEEWESDFDPSDHSGFLLQRQDSD